VSDHPPPGLDRDHITAWRAAFHARRAAIVAGASTWQEGARRLHAAGELSDGMLVALGLEIQTLSH
jgi:hypothetical protein